MSARPARTLITILMDLLIVLAVLLVASLVVQFFGALAGTTWGEAIVKIADLVTLPLGIDPVKTPYGGVFDLDTGVTIGILLMAEWILGGVRSRA